MNNAVFCNHSLGIYSDMDTVLITPDSIHRRCSVCNKEEYLPRAGKLQTGYSVQAESVRDNERRHGAVEFLNQLMLLANARVVDVPAGAVEEV